MTSFSKKRIVSQKSLASFSNLNYINVKEYGAVGNGSTDDATAIQNAINASITAYGDVRIYFPGGRYKVNTLLSVDNATVNVSILGFNSTLVSGISSVGSSVLYVLSAKSLIIDKLNIDFNNQNTVQYGYRIGDESNSKYVGVCEILNCDFYNFGTEATRGIYAAGVPFVSGLTANYNLPSLLIDGCNFYNQNTSNTINYSTATYYGYGIQLADKCDYARIANCNFNFIRVGLYNTSSGNTDVTGCNFLGCLPKTSSLYTYGCITVPNTGTNNGKINVVACKFNHSYGYSIYYAYATAERPLTVSSCHFISNATTAIYCTHTSTVATRHQIHNNYFERCSQAFTNSYTNQPFGASLQPFIYLNNQLRCSVRLNTFLNDATYGVTTANSADYNLIKNNNWFNITGASSVVGANNVVSDNDNL